jgi:hypothetical protein
MRCEVVYWNGILVARCTSIPHSDERKEELHHKGKTHNPRSIQIVEEEDINGATKYQCNDEDIESSLAGGKRLTIPRAVGTSPSDNVTPSVSFFAPAGRTVCNCCGICLESYQPGEVVAWSSSCKHVFHQDCIASYFLSKKTLVEEMPCPCCRQKFC